MRFTDFTYEELRDLAPTVEAVLIPLGCTEQQGPHMQVHADTRMVEALCLDAAAKLDAEGLATLVLPALPFGPTPEHAGYGAGYVNLRQSTHEAIVEDILDSLEAQGYRRLMVWRGCGQHELGATIDAFNARSTSARAYQPVCDYGRICSTVIGDIPGGHADSFATSIALHLGPENIREDRIPAASPDFEWAMEMDFSSISATGVLGDPGLASRENGAALWRLCIDEAVSLVRAIVEGVPVREGWHFKDSLPPQ